MDPSKKRKWRNFLIEPRFQLKFSSALVMVAVVLVMLLGGVLFHNTQALIDEVGLALKVRAPANQATVAAQQEALVRRERLVWVAFGGTLIGFVVLMTLSTIVLTHRVAGPLMRIRRMVTDVASGKLRPPPYGLREKDELKDLFDATRGMVHVLRKQQEDDVLVLAHALERAQQQGAAGEWVEDLRALESRIRARL